MNARTSTFQLSDEFVSDKRQFFLFFGAAVIAVSVFVMLARENYDLAKIGSSQLAVMLTICGVVLIPIYVVWLDMQRRWRQIKLHVGSGGIVREAGDAREEISWDSITEVKRYTDKSGKLQGYHILSQREPTMILVGIERMIDLVRLVDIHLPSAVPVRSKSQWINVSNNSLKFALIGVSLASGLLVAEFTNNAGTKFDPAGFRGLFDAAFGLWFLWYGPLTRLYPSFLTLERLLGILLLLGGVSHIATALI